MADQTKRGGQKTGVGRGDKTKQHQGVRPGSTTQNKKQRQERAEKRPDKKTRVIDDEPHGKE